MTLGVLLPVSLLGGAGDLPGGRNAELVAKVRSGAISEAKASWWGYDTADSTEAIQSAISCGVKKLIIDAQSGPWYVRPLKGVSNQEIVIEKGAVLCAKRGAFKDRLDVLLDYRKVENVKISGPGELRMWREDYTNRADYCWSEWRHALSFQGAKNVTVENLTISRSGGDGIYVNDMTDTVIRNVTCDRNYRQGISVISAENLLIEGCTLSNTAGTAPAAGIDFEPNSNRERLVNCTMRNCLLKDNQVCGILFALFYFDATTRPVSISVENCRVVGNGQTMDIDAPHSPINAVKGRISFRGCAFERTAADAKGIHVRECLDLPVKLDFADCTYREFAADGTAKATALGEAWIAERYPEANKTPVSYPPRFRHAPATYAAVDAKPGQMVALAPLYARDPVMYAFYAAKAGEVRFAAKQVLLGKNKKLSDRPVEVCDMSGKAVGSFPMGRIGTDETPFAVRVPAAGYYTMKFPNRGGTLLLLTQAEAPVAVDLSEKCVNVNGHPARGWLSVPEDAAPFALLAFGDGGEMVHATVRDPSGRVAFDRDNISMWVPFVPAAKPAAGLWQVDLTRPSEGVLDDFRLDLSGVKPYLFLSNEKYWK